MITVSERFTGVKNDLFATSAPGRVRQVDCNCLRGYPSHRGASTNAIYLAYLLDPTEAGLYQGAEMSRQDCTDRPARGKAGALTDLERVAVEYRPYRWRR